MSLLTRYRVWRVRRAFDKAMREQAVLVLEAMKQRSVTARLQANVDRYIAGMDAARDATR